MHSTLHTDLKQLILTSWRDRWTEKKWSVNICKYLVHSSDVFHVADALVSQAFIGPSPNHLLLEYIWHALNTGLLSYGSIITAISKHEELHKVQSTKGVYKLLQQLITILNRGPIIEDVMHLCSALRMILQWLLRNIEQYLKGVHDVHPAVAEDLLQLNCYTLEQLTTKPRTSALLTIARFEESGVWSHIETDLAVIKNSSGQHSMHAEISESCHHVSQLSRCSIKPQAVYKHESTSQLCLSVSSLIILEVELKRQTENQGIAQQLVMLSQVHGLLTSQLLFHCFQTCLIGYLDSIQQKNDCEAHWSAMIFLRMPKIIQQIKSQIVGSEFDSPSGMSSKKAATFDANFCESLNRLAAMDSLLDTLDQHGGGIDWIKILTEHLSSKRLLTDTAATNIQETRNLFRQNMAMDAAFENVNPLMIVKMESTVEQLINILGSSDVTSDLERLLNMLQSLSTSSSFELFTAAASTSGQLSAICSKLILCNDAVKVSSGENTKTAQMRAVIFDITFLMACQMVKTYGKDRLIEVTHHNRALDSTFLYSWINTWCQPHINSVQTKTLPSEPSNVNLLIQTLRNSNEFRIGLAKWHDVSSNMPQAVLELMCAYQKGYIKAADLNRAVSIIRDHCPLSVCMAVSVSVANRARLCHSHTEHVNVLEKLTSKSENHQQLQPLYDQRYTFFSSLLGHFIGDLVPELKKNKTKSNKSVIKSLQDAFCSAVNAGWIDLECMMMFHESLQRLGVSAFMRCILSLVLQETRLDAVNIAVDVTFACMRLDMRSMVIYLLKYGIPQHFMSEAHMLAPPIGRAIARLVVAGLDIALNDAVLHEKSLLQRQPINPFLHEMKPEQDLNLKVRRMLSCSTEHDLSANASGIPPNHPLVTVLEEFLQCLWKALKDHKWGPIPDFVSAFIKMALYSTPLLSSTVKQSLTTKMVQEFSSFLVKENRELLFAASDLGNPEVRHVAAQAICQIENLS